MEKSYVLIINGYEQKVLGEQKSLETIMAVINNWRSDGRLKNTDKVSIRTIIVFEEELQGRI